MSGSKGSPTASAPADQQDEDVAAADNKALEPVDEAQAETQDNRQDAAEVETAQTSDEPASADWEQEYALWKAASDGNTVTEYEAYLKAYPDGKFAAIAQARIAQLAAAEQPDPTIAEGDQQDDATAPKNNVARNRKKNNAVDQADDQAAAQDDATEPGDDQDMANQDMANQDGMDDQQANSNMGGLKAKRNQNADDQQQAQFTEGSEDAEDDEGLLAHD